MGSNCKNCGAPKSGPVCAYCGTVFDQQAALSLAVGKDVHMKFKHQGLEYEFTIRLDDLHIEDESETETFYADSLPYFVLSHPRYRVSLGGEVVPSVMHGSECLICYREIPPEEVTE